MTAVAPASVAAAPADGLSSALLLTAVALAASWAAVTALFAKNFSLTTYSEAARGKLLLGWPYLAAFSRKFRSQFLSALRGEKVKVKDAEDGGASD
jgi:hypothetical protein